MNCLAFLNRRYLDRQAFKGVPLSFAWVDGRVAGLPAGQAAAGAASAGRALAVRGPAGGSGQVAMEIRRAAAVGAAV